MYVYTYINMSSAAPFFLNKLHPNGLLLAAFDGNVCSFHTEVVLHGNSRPPEAHRCEWFLSETKNNNHHTIQGQGNKHVRMFFITHVEV